MRLLFIITLLVGICSQSQAHSESCLSLFDESSRNPLDSEFVAKLNRTFRERTFLAIDRLKKPYKKNKLNILPQETKDVPVKIDTIDRIMWKVTDSLQSEMGRWEIKNEKGETIGVNIHSSGHQLEIKSNASQIGLIKALAQAYASGEYFDIKKIIHTHTHPFPRGSLSFSGGDYEFYLYTKQKLEVIGLAGVDSESDLLGFSWSPLRGIGFNKKGLLIPGEVFALDSAYSYESWANGEKIWVEISKYAQLLKNGTISAKDLIFEMPRKQMDAYLYYSNKE